jgi:HlyD family secretion protein
MAENNNRKRIVLSVVAVLGVLGIVLIARRGRDPSIQVASVTREDLSSTITSNGRVEPISAVTAHAEFPTFVDNVFATEGQAVHKGQPILTLDSSDIRSQLAQAQAELITAQTNLRNARAGGPPDEVAQVEGDLRQAQVDVANLEQKHKSLEQLVAKQAATHEELTQNEAALAKAQTAFQVLEQKKKALKERSIADASGAELRVAQAQSQIESLAEKARSANVVASSDGTLYSFPVHTGDFVKVGDVLAVMADLHHVRVRAFVDEPDLGGLEPNQEVEVTWDAKPGVTWTGHTEQIPKQVVPRGERSVGEVLCTVDNAKLDLLPNVNVDVRILVRKRNGVLVVPRAAVLEDKGQFYVYLVSEGKIQRRSITLGIASASKYEVASGLSLNDRIAIPGDEPLRDGMSVRVAEGT